MYSEDLTDMQFESVSTEVSGVDFINLITESKEKNYFTYPYMYMGGGVAVGDINNDGLDDIYFTGNMTSNKLYLNKGNMVFEDITNQAGVSGDERWYTGATMEDINGDGHLDIYVCVSGKWGSTANQLFINKGNLTFKEEAKTFGIADAGNSTQACFLDYDRDGDLDLYVANYPPLHFKVPHFVYAQSIKNPKHESSDHIYRNDRGTFRDVTNEAGILNFGLSLSAIAADFNNDGWQDIYVSNDFAAPDQLYLNKKNGTFEEQSRKCMNHTAFYGMGTDVADINNDGWLDLFQVDMTPEDNYRSKVNMASMAPDELDVLQANDLHCQYMENVLQLNYGITAAGLPIFGDVSRMTNTALTDWSWSPLFVDFDNDGWKDLHVTNGTRRDINNKDFFKKFDELKNELSSEELFQQSLKIPSVPIDNYIFKNETDLTFSKANKEWGLESKGFSNGSAYADFDKDGDIDLVINNIDQPASVLRNNGTSSQWLRVKLNGPSFNQNGLGSRVEIYADGNYQMVEINRTRGFQSCSEAVAHFGLGSLVFIDSVKINWFDGQQHLLKGISSGQQIEVQYSSGMLRESTKKTAENRLFKDITSLLNIGFEHTENAYDDFQHEVLLPHKTSRYGPGLATGDLNGDGLDDFFIGGASGQSGAIYLQEENGGFSPTSVDVFAKDRIHEDLGALFVDVDNDGDLDLYVVSGGNEEPANDIYYKDRMYLWDDGNFKSCPGCLPDLRESGSRAKSIDYDNDGDQDLVVGGRMVPGNYGIPANTRVLRNDSSGDKVVFVDATMTVAPGLISLGMVTDIAWTDFDMDGWTDLIFVGEWMPVTFFKNNQGYFFDITDQLGYSETIAWYYCINTGDFNNDGITDLVLGNLGKNYKYQASQDESFDIYLGDFDNNGKRDIVLGYYFEGTQFPLRGRQCSSQQIPGITQEYGTYDAFASANLADIYGRQALDNSIYHYKVNDFSSQVWIGIKDGKYEIQSLPRLAQVSNITQVIIEDFNKDGNEDLLVAGNHFVSEVETKRNDASIGCLLRGTGKGTFDPIALDRSGFVANRDIRDMALMRGRNHKIVIVANNNDQPQLMKLLE